MCSLRSSSSMFEVDGGVADVGVDLATGGDADAHRLQLGVVDVRGDDEASGGDLIADEFGGDAFATSDVLHLLGDVANAGEVHLRHVGVAGAGGFGFAFHDPFGAWLEDFKSGVLR